MRSKILPTTGLSALLACVVLGQSLFGDGEFKGFTRSPTEHIINSYKRVVTARTFEGSVVDPSGAPIQGAIVEVRGPGAITRVRGTETDRRGQFRVGRLSAGAYAFKSTHDGFQSVVGQLKIDSSKERKVPTKITLQVGV